ncbi:MAG: 1-aminocyclopropane-1-carboxylate deaminase/D-cysteine desulfhydrase [Gammaproteobacteria bacterium]
MSEAGRNKDAGDFWQRLEALPRLALMQAPTPLQPLRNLSGKMSGEIWCKRDDLIPFGLGGNKIRGLELLAADALSQQADVLVTGAGAQSNHVRASAMVACHFDLRCRAVFWGEPPNRIDGNYRITRMLGAEVVFTGDAERSSVDSGIARQCEDMLLKGSRPYPIPRGGACALGALGHALAARELYLQCRDSGIAPKTIVLATGSGGTHAGWLLGTKVLGNPWAIESYTVSREADDVRREIARLAKAAAELLEQDSNFAPEDVVVQGGYIGDGYGIPSPEAAAAIRLLARSEGILLDPTYTGKAMAGLLDRIRHSHDGGYPLVFIHSGGGPAFFAGDGQWLDSVFNEGQRLCI